MDPNSNEASIGVDRAPQPSSYTAEEYISNQLQLEADAREALPYQFDSCTKPLGPLRQSVFSCLTCNPPPENPSMSYNPAGVCYSCSISCHGEHELVELFSRRDFECDCGTTRVPSSSTCSLRSSIEDAQRADAHSRNARKENQYNQNFRNRFCGCGELYNPHQQKGTMFQCLGIGTISEGGCGEDWWHPECVLGINNTWRRLEPDGSSTRGDTLNGHLEDSTVSAHEPQTSQASNGNENRVSAHTPDDPITTDNIENIEADEDDELPPGFPAEANFDQFICYKCVDAFPWIKRYAGTPGFLPAVMHRTVQTVPTENRTVEHNPNENLVVPQVTGESITGFRKRKSHEAGLDEHLQADHANHKKLKDNSSDLTQQKEHSCRHHALPPAPSDSTSLFLKEDFRDWLCRCNSCFPLLKRHPQLLEEEDTYEPPLSEGSSAGRVEGSTHSAGSRSLLERGEAALSNMDRVRAIEGVMAYNHLRDKVKDFLKPFADSGQAVGAEDVKKYFEQLRGDEQAIREAAKVGDGNGDDEGDNRREQSGY